MEKLSKFKVTQLKQISKELGLPITGAKIELIARLTMMNPDWHMDADECNDDQIRRRAFATRRYRSSV